MERPYLDVEGNTQPASAVDVHHVFARQYARSSSDRDFINLSGNKLKMFRVCHNIGPMALHSNVANLRLPGKDLRWIIRQNLMDSAGENVYDRYLDMVGQVANVADYSLNPGMKKETARVGSNLRRQTPYILQGQVRDLSEASHDIQ